MQQRNILRAAGVVGGATLASRILGYVRDMVIAYFFGTATSADAFFVAFRIPNLFRRLFAEGSLTVAFIPVFSEYLVKESKKDALEFANVIFTFLSIILAVLCCLGIAFSPVII
ncbi:MAG: lipid II flippase MurJ, partial [Thermodesulfobacteriota bacterium]|nr:lipid II flippase MurJ [Thermodesulfobacteriota bacterium]